MNKSKLNLEEMIKITGIILPIPVKSNDHIKKKYSENKNYDIYIIRTLYHTGYGSNDAFLFPLR